MRLKINNAHLKEFLPKKIELDSNSEYYIVKESYKISIELIINKLGGESEISIKEKPENTASVRERKEILPESGHAPAFTAGMY